MELPNQTNSYYYFKLLGQSLFLLAEKAIFWKEKSTLILSDIHLGKAAHFRKSGIQIPELVHISDYQRLKKLVNTFRPKRIILLGDIFHSEFNDEWSKFRDWLEGQDQTDIILVMGNHDILPNEMYRLKNLDLIERSYSDDPFVFIHQNEKTTNSGYAISGHIHPGVRITGHAKQSLALPCFYFSDKYAILPVFGKFTGMARIKPREQDDIFVIFENTVHKM